METILLSCPAQQTGTPADSVCYRFGTGKPDRLLPCTPRRELLFLPKLASFHTVHGREARPDAALKPESAVGVAPCHRQTAELYS